MKEKGNDTKEVIRSGKSKKDKPCSDQKKKYKVTKDGLQNTAQKNKDWVTRTALWTVSELVITPNILTLL